jgi:hypothetical protein
MREPQLGVAVGKKGVGKSFTTNIYVTAIRQWQPCKRELQVVGL